MLSLSAHPVVEFRNKARALSNIWKGNSGLGLLIEPLPEIVTPLQGAPNFQMRLIYRILWVLGTAKFSSWAS